MRFIPEGRLSFINNKSDVIKNNQKVLFLSFFFFNSRMCVHHESHLIRWGVLVEVQGGGRLPQQGFQWSNLWGAAGAAV